MNCRAIPRNEKEKKTRWESVQKRAKNFVSSIKPGCHLWICSFSSHKIVDGSKPPKYDLKTSPFTIFQPKFETLEDQQNVLKLIDNGVGSPAGYTFLYDAMGLAFTEARRLSLENEKRFVSVLVYTDGIDNKSQKWKTREELEKAFARLRELNDNVWVLINPIELDNDEEVFDGPNVRIGAPEKLSCFHHRHRPDWFGQPGSKTETSLPNRIYSPAGYLVATQWGRGQTQTMFPKAAMASFRNSNFPNIRLRRGKNQVELTVLNATQLDPTKRESGRIELEFLNTGKTQIICRRAIDVSFRVGNRFEIFEARPKTQMSFALNQPIHFWVHGSHGAKILWEFEDGTTRSESEFYRAFTTAGKKQVKLKLLGTKADRPAEKSISFEVVEIPLELQIPKLAIYEGDSISLTGRMSKRLSSLEALINGLPKTIEEFDIVEDSNHFRFETVFNAAGEYKIQLIAKSDSIRSIKTPVYRILARSLPSILINSQTETQTVRLFSNARFSFDLPSTQSPQIDWDLDFGHATSDAKSAKSPNATEVIFRPERPGTYLARARLEWSDGRIHTLEKTYRVETVDPVAKIKALKKEKFFLNDSSDIADDSKGDISVRRWYHTRPDGSVSQVPDGVSNIQLDQLGTHKLKLETIGFENRDSGKIGLDSDEKIIEVFPRFPWIPFALTAMTMLAIWLAATYLAFWNYPRRWRVLGERG